MGLQLGKCLIGGSRCMGMMRNAKNAGLVVVGDQIVKDPSNLGVALDCYFVRVT